MPNAVIDVLILNRCPHPNVRWYSCQSEDITEFLPESHSACGSLCEHLIDVAVRPKHHIEHPNNEIIGDVVVEEIRHRVDEHHARRGPRSRMLQAIWPEPHGEWISPIGRRVHDRPSTCVDVVETLTGERFGVTVVATGSDLRAASDRIPCRVSPFDSGPQAHRRPPERCDRATEDMPKLRTSIEKSKGAASDHPPTAPPFLNHPFIPP